MSQLPDPKKAASARPLITALLLGAAPLITGENARSYNELLAHICASLQPRDALEEIWVRDIVDLAWETFRLRRAKACLMTDEAGIRLENELDNGQPGGRQIIREWAAGDEEAAARVSQALIAADLTMDRMLARAVSSSLGTTERLDRLLLRVEGRRSAAMRELERYRAPLAQKLRHAIAEAEEAALVPDAPRIAPPQPA